MPVPGPNELALYSGTWDCARKTVTKEGIRGLYKGIYIYAIHVERLSHHNIFLKHQRYFSIYLILYKNFETTVIHL